VWPTTSLQSGQGKAIPTPDTPDGSIACCLRKKASDYMAGRFTPKASRICFLIGRGLLQLTVVFSLTRYCNRHRLLS
jgi:hypothetical protein